MEFILENEKLVVKTNSPALTLLQKAIDLHTVNGTKMTPESFFQDEVNSIQINDLQAHAMRELLPFLKILNED